jgi:hypothetical protein
MNKKKHKGQKKCAHICCKTNVFTCFYTLWDTFNVVGNWKVLVKKTKTLTEKFSIIDTSLKMHTIIGNIQSKQLLNTVCPK